jgi:hypothetical protein
LGGGGCGSEKSPPSSASPILRRFSFSRPVFSGFSPFSSSFAVKREKEGLLEEEEERTVRIGRTSRTTFHFHFWTERRGNSVGEKIKIFLSFSFRFFIHF